MKKYLPIYSVILLLIFISSCKGKAQTESAKNNTPPPQQLEKKPSDFDPYFIETQTITSPNSPTSITRNILQDKDGNIWLATWEGIIRYNPNLDNSVGWGKSFTNFTNKDSLRRFHVFSLLEDSKGILWFGTIGAGVYRYDGKNFTNITTKDGLVDDVIGCVYEDKSGNIWFGTQAGVSHYNGKTFQNFTIKDGLPNDDINSIIEDQHGKLWFGARGKACIYENGKFTIFTNNGIPFQNVRSIIEDKKGDIWLGGDNGLWRYNSNSIDSIGQFTNFTKDFVGFIYEDSKGNIWTSSNVPVMGPFWALTRYDAKTLTPTVIKEEANMFFGILEDKEDKIWLGHLRGVYRYDGIDFK